MLIRRNRGRRIRDLGGARSERLIGTMVWGDKKIGS